MPRSLPPSSLYILAHRLHAVFSVLPDHAHDGAFPQWLHPTRQPFSSPAPGGDAKAHRAGTSDASLASATISPMSVVIFSHAGDAQGGHQIKEALRLPCDHADALMGGGSHQEIRSTP